MLRQVITRPMINEFIPASGGAVCVPEGQDSHYYESRFHEFTEEGRSRANPTLALDGHEAYNDSSVDVGTY